MAPFVIKDLFRIGLILFPLINNEYWWIASKILDTQLYRCTFHFTNFNQAEIWNLCYLGLPVKVFIVMKIQFNKQSVELSFFLNNVKIFPYSKICVYVWPDFSFGLVFCFLKPFRKGITRNSTSPRTHEIKILFFFDLTVRYRRYRTQDWTLPVPGTIIVLHLWYFRRYHLLFKLLKYHTLNLEFAFTKNPPFLWKITSAFKIYMTYTL